MSGHTPQGSVIARGRPKAGTATGSHDRSGLEMDREQMLQLANQVADHQVNQCTWLTSSGPSQLELVVIDWIRQWVGYPEGAGGLLTSGGSVATITALVAAREAGRRGGQPTVYMSDQSHSAQIRAARIVGVEREHVRLVASDRRAWSRATGVSGWTSPTSGSSSLTRRAASW